MHKFIILLVLLALGDWLFLYIALKSINKFKITILRKKIKKLFIIIELIVLFLTTIFVLSNLVIDIEPYIYYNFFLILNGFLIFWFIPKLFFLILYVPYYLMYFITKSIFNLAIFSKYYKNFVTITKFYILSTWIVFTFTYFFILHAIFINRVDINVKKIEFSHQDIPKGFNNIKILMFSDFHLGSYFSTKEIEKIVDTINAQKADFVLFAGDLVNMQIEEATQYTNILKKIEAKYKKYSVLGNHDMDDYRKWIKMKDSIYIKEKAILDFYESIDFKLLNNTHEIIKIAKDSIAIIGVENWGLSPFKQNGKIKKATHRISDSIFKILISHDPSHWEAQIKEKTNIQLTLSGHTHGGQITFEFFNYKFSPISLMYPYWHGMYKLKQQYLYVSNGIGYLGFPGRFGAKPEIVVITLKSTSD